MIFEINPTKFTIKMRLLYREHINPFVAHSRLVDVKKWEGSCLFFFTINTNHIATLGGFTPIFISLDRRGLPHIEWHANIPMANVHQFAFLTASNQANNTLPLMQIVIAHITSWGVKYYSLYYNNKDLLSVQHYFLPGYNKDLSYDYYNDEPTMLGNEILGKNVEGMIMIGHQII